MRAFALWWAQHVSLVCDGHRTLVPVGPGETHASTLLRLIEELDPKPTSLRLIYQPHDLLMHPVECPNAGRRAIQQALAHEHPAITTDVVAWAFQRLEPTAKGAQTLLSFERTPLLARFVTDLEKIKIRLDGAFPLMTLLELLPAFESSGFAIGIAHTETTALVHCRDESGARSVHTFEGPGADSRTVSFIGQFTEDTSRHPALSVLYDPPHQWPFSSLTATTTVSPLALMDFLPEAARIPLKDPSNLLPASAIPSPNALAYLAAAACLAVSLGLIAKHELAQADARSQAAVKEIQRAQLADDITQRRSTVTVMDRAARLTADVGHSPAGLAVLLRSFDEALPRELTLISLRQSAESFTIEGTAHAGIGDKEGPYFAFFDAMGEATRPWKITTKRPATLASADFSISGNFNP
jgi:hypothetical protein